MFLNNNGKMYYVNVYYDVINDYNFLEMALFIYNKRRHNVQYLN